MSIQNIRESLRKEIRDEMQLKKHIESKLLSAPDGALNENIIKNEKYYYQRVYIDGKRVSIILDPYDDYHREVIEELREKKTMIHGLPILRKNIDAMGKCLSKIEPYHPMNFKYGRHVRGDLYLPEDVCFKEWIEKEDNQNPYHPEQRIHETKRGVPVRSKSEMLISDILFDNNIRYKNETELRLEGRSFYPDFEIFHNKTHRIIWWEHLGKLDDPRYVYRNMEKIIVYGRNGIVLGDNLILTFETSEDPLTRGAVVQALHDHDLI